MITSKTAINQEVFNLIREYIQQECGIILGDDKISLVESRLSKIVIQSKCSSFKDFYLLIKKDKSKKLRDIIINAITTNETMWFRDLKQWELVKNIILPKYINDLRRENKDRVIIWSVASSTGQEPYSMAMLIQEALLKEPKVKLEQFFIIATDISRCAMFLAISGRYNKTAMSKGMLPGYEEKFFKTSKEIWEINQSIKDMVHFKQFDNQDYYEDFPNLDIIFCKNTTGYYTPKIQKEAFRIIQNKLDKDGYLFLGTTETISNLSSKFFSETIDNCQFYRIKNLK